MNTHFFIKACSDDTDLVVTMNLHQIVEWWVSATHFLVYFSVHLHFKIVSLIGALLKTSF